MRQNGALQIFPQVTLYVLWHRVYHPIRACLEPTRALPQQPRLQILLHHLIRHTPHLFAGADTPQPAALGNYQLHFLGSSTFRVPPLDSKPE